MYQNRMSLPLRAGCDHPPADFKIILSFEITVSGTPPIPTGDHHRNAWFYNVGSTLNETWRWEQEGIFCICFCVCDLTMPAFKFLSLSTRASGNALWYRKNLNALSFPF